MTDDELAFIRAASAEPDEDTLRLAYADWLDEQGGEVFASQAAFVRLQVRRSRLDPFDPDRAALLEQEAALLQKHKRDWNGRVHRFLTRSGFAHKVDARRGVIRGWDYRRGMVGRVTITPEAMTAHAETTFALGPVECLHLATWPTLGWELGSARTLSKLLPRLKAVSLAGTHANYPLLNTAVLRPFADVPLLDLRSVGLGLHQPELLVLARSGALSPVVLYSRAVPTTRTHPLYGRDYVVQESHAETFVIDPHGKWDALRLRYADLIGKVLSPVVYQGTSR